MLKISIEEIVSALSNARNLNATIKKFLRNEVNHDVKSERFAKNVKTVFSGSNLEAKASFVSKSLPEYEMHFMVVAGYAYSEEISAVTSLILNKFADEFNATYRKASNAIEFVDQEKFKAIVIQVNKVVDETISKLGLTSSNFMKNVMFSSIFEKEVLEVVEPLVDQH